VIYVKKRETGKVEKETIYGEKALLFLYRKGILARCLRFLICRFPIFSRLYGLWQRLPLTKRKIAPFVTDFNLDPDEFETPLSTFTSFHDFFIRRLKPRCRPLASSPAIIPADGRYLFFQEVSKDMGFTLKNTTYSLVDLLEDETLAARYHGGTVILGRLAPSDTHRFWFPCDGIPDEETKIRGNLFSVNPLALASGLHTLSENKRTFCSLHSQEFGTVLLMEIGATNVGSIHQTYIPHHFVQKGEEKGYFDLGASMLVLLFEPNTLQLERDLAQKEQELEILCQMGQALGKPL